MTHTCHVLKQTDTLDCFWLQLLEDIERAAARGRASVRSAFARMLSLWHYGEGKLKENNIMHTFLIQITYPLGWLSLAPTCFCNLSLESAKPRTPQTCLKHVSNMCQQLVACIAELSISQLFRITFRTDQPSPIARLGHSWTSERLNCWSQQLRTARQSNVPT